MLSVAEAQAAVLARTAPLPAMQQTVRTACGLVLAEDVAADLDAPPFDKSMVDGYAVVAADAAGGRVELAVVEEVPAGRVAGQSVSRGTAIRIMTGAPIPTGADAVVRLEGTSTRGDRVIIDGQPVRTGQNILRQGSSFAAGQTLLRSGAVIRPIESGILCEVGRTSVLAIPRPRAAVIATGDELVPPEAVPGPGQIRNSNAMMLEALAAQAGAESQWLGTARDDRAELANLVRQGLRYDVLILSGGVSAGAYDLVPAVLEELGVEQVFHKVSLKPGKPIWFGVGRPRDTDGRAALVFGLPGNPVSSLVCFCLLVRPALAQLAGRVAQRSPLAGHLAVDYFHRSDRPTYFPAASRTDAGRIVVEPVPWGGSADLAALHAADALIHFPPGERKYAAGDAVETYPL